MSSSDKKCYPEDEEICVSRIDATRMQVNAAIRSYFLYDDYVSAMTLAGAAERVLSDLQPQDGLIGIDAISIRSLINLFVPDEYSKEAAQHLRGPYDFLRHADLNKFEDFRVHPLYVEFMIFLASQAYKLVTNNFSMEMQISQVWFVLRHPQLLKEDAPLGDVLSKLDFDPNTISKSDFFTQACEFFALQSNGKENG